VYSDDAQPLTTTFAEYLLPAAPEVPRIGVVHIESPTPINPLGVKGAGEGGTIPALAAIVAAVEDALSPYGVRIDEVPIVPGRIVQLIAEARQRRAA
jgi:carbon-monoxide dehydrogenase large subunit